MCLLHGTRLCASHLPHRQQLGGFFSRTSLRIRPPFHLGSQTANTAVVRGGGTSAKDLPGRPMAQGLDANVDNGWRTSTNISWPRGASGRPGGCHGHDSVTLRLPRAKHQHACTRAPGASRMTVDRKGHGEMRRTGAPRETPSCARLFLCSFPIFPHKPVVVAHTHACHGNSLEVDFEAFRVVTSQHASSAFAPASRTDHRKFCEHHESHTRYAMAGA